MHVIRTERSPLCICRGFPFPIIYVLLSIIFRTISLQKVNKMVMISINLHFTNNCRGCEANVFGFIHSVLPSVTQCMKRGLIFYWDRESTVQVLIIVDCRIKSWIAYFDDWLETRVSFIIVIVTILLGNINSKVFIA